MQTRSKSLLETVTSTAFGFFIAMLASQAYYHDQTWTRNIGFTAIMTCISLTRGYLWRRLFNWLDSRKERG